jgi:hypothetical protein
VPAPAARETEEQRRRRHIAAVRSASTYEAASHVLDGLRAALRADHARTLVPGDATTDPRHGACRVLGDPHETRTDDDRPCVLIRAESGTGRVWLTYEETI